MIYGNITSTANWDPWPIWTTTTNYTSTTVSTVAWTDPWPLWTSASTTTTTGDTFIPYIWTIWNQGCGNPASVRRAQQVVSSQRIREPTPEELQARLRQEQEWRAQAEARGLKEKEAKEKAEALLRQFLTAEQIESLEKRKFFQLESISKDGSRKRYEIQRGRQGNVFLLDQKGERVESYCIHPSEYIPDADTMLTQKLLLESNEELFLRTANRTRLRQAAR